MALYRFVERPGPLRAPVLLLAFDAWVDAGGAASAAAAHIARDGVRIATFDGDELLDYRARRPILDVVNGEPKTLAWQELTVTHAGEKLARDLLVLTGPEPDHRWKEFSSSVLAMALELGVVQTIALGAIPAAVPHTRPVPIIATASPPTLLPDDEVRPEGILRVPAAALSVVQIEIAEHGIPTVGFFAQIPHYVSAPYSAGVLALVQRVEAHLMLDIGLGQLPDEARDQREQLDAIVQTRPEIASHVEQLEQMAPEPGLAAGGRIPSGDEIAAEVEKYLRGNER